MQQKINQIKAKINAVKAERKILEQELTDKQSKLTQLQTKKVRAEADRMILQTVAKSTQSSLSLRTGNMVSLALASVFNDPYEFVLKFVERRNKTEADCLFRRGELESKPEDTCGVGSIDIGAFGARATIWNMQSPKTRPILILDEAFKHLRGKRDQERASNMIVALANELNLQVIMTADTSFAIKADRIFDFVLKRGITEVNQL